VNIQGTQSVARVVKILRVVAAHGADGAALKDVVGATGLHRATAHRLLSALAGEGLLERHPLLPRFRVGIELAALVQSGTPGADLKGIAAPSLDRLTAGTGCMLYLGVRSGYDGLCVDMRRPRRAQTPVRLHVNDRWPLGVGSFSMALLAWLPDAEVAAVIRRNASRLKGQVAYGPQQLARRVEETRRRGYALDCVAVYPGMSGVGVPVLDPYGRAAASLCAVSAGTTIEARRLAQLVKDLQHEAQCIAGRWFGTDG